MCDVCSDFLELLHLFEEKVFTESEKHPGIVKHDFEVVASYIQSWSQRQCMCCFRDPKNFERFYLLTRTIICQGIRQLQDLANTKLVTTPVKPTKPNDGNNVDIEKLPSPSGDAAPNSIVSGEEKVKSEEGATSSKEKVITIESEDNEEQNNENRPKTPDEAKREVWTIADKEKLLQLLSKVFLVNFPLYIAYKHNVHAKLAELSQTEATSLNTYCDLHDTEIPVFLLRNVYLFCKGGGLQAMMACFELPPALLPVSVAHTIIAIVCNLKLWLNFRATTQLFVPLRANVLRYMCGLTDTDLRTSNVKSMADYMWSSMKDPLDSPVTFDRDGMDLAFKYFMSSTLTMRLAGIAQINSHINLFNELCHNESVMDIEMVGQRVASWLIDNQIISHIFGPNLHVEVIKQSHVILSFLAMECKITNEHIDTIWQAAQLKHCSKQVHDLLPPLIKNLDGGPVLHLYNLLFKLPPKDHTEQSFYLASALIKFIWASGGPCGSSQPVGVPALGGGPVAMLARHVAELSSSEASVSLEASGSDDDAADSSPHSRKTASDASDGPSPCKQRRKRARPHEDDSSDDTAKIDELDEDKEQNDRNVAQERYLGLPLAPGAGLAKAMYGPERDKGRVGSDNEADAEDNLGKGGDSDKKKVLRRHKKPPPPRKSIERCVNVCKVMKLGSRGCCSDDDDCDDTASDDEHGICSPHKDPSMLNIRQASEFVQVMSEEAAAHGRTMSELAGLVHRSAAGDMRTARPFLRSFQAHDELVDEMSADDGSYSSRMSNKSEKNMADFDGEDSGCDDELVRLSQVKAMHLSLPPHLGLHSARSPACKLQASRGGSRSAGRILARFPLDSVCKPGNTLLWDLLQDDKILQLGEGLDIEAEKALFALLCFNTERSIRMKFIEGCLDNLAKNWSVVVSLRLLPKLLISFQQFRGMDTHNITAWAEREHDMMAHFFNNLQTYTKDGPRGSLYSHQMEVQVRLTFLSSVFSPTGSADSFRLSVAQVDILWSCLATDPRCCDDLFSWLLCQAKSKEADKTKPEEANNPKRQMATIASFLGRQTSWEDPDHEYLFRNGHALGPDSLKHLYVRKLPSLRPETMSMTGLALFQQLCNFARLASLHQPEHLMNLPGSANAAAAAANEMDLVGMDHLWKIALRASNTDVSMAAIQYLNGYYVGRQLGQETEFVSQCMAHLGQATTDLTRAEDAGLLCIQRALLLLKTHLETFKRRYAYHLRRWALEGQAVGSHVQLFAERGVAPVRLVVQPAGSTERHTLELASTDYVADLRAEVTKWWESLQPQLNADKKKETTPVLGSLLSEGPIRMITQGSELTVDFDEKTLEEMGFKDLQNILISMSACRALKKRDSLDMPSVLPPPPRESLPTLLLLQPHNFEQLFTLMDTLSAMKTTMKGHQIPHTKAQVLSRRVWDILTLLPTSPTLLRGFQQLDISLPQLLDPGSPQKLMYSLYIVESLSRKSNYDKGKGDGIADGADASNWNHRFVQYGGLRHLFDIFMSGVLQKCGGGDGSEWQQDCLASLLKLLCQLGVATDDADGFYETEGGLRTKRARKRRASSDKMVVPKLNEAMLLMMTVDSVMARLTSILHEASLPRDPNHYKTGFWGRAQVVHYAMALLVSWAHSSGAARQALFAGPHFESWLRRLVLEDPEPAVRREVCTALYRLCLCGPRDGDAGTATFNVTAHMLGQLMEYLSVAEGMRSQRMEAPGLHHAIEDGKEPYGPACRDYFWLLCRLVDSLDAEYVKECLHDPNESVINIDDLAKKLAESILAREYLETRHNTVEDDGLIGLINLMHNVVKFDPPFKASKAGQEFLEQMFELLFALPDPQKRYVPKCKSPLSRSSALDLVVELAKGAPDNYRRLHEKLLAQHRPGPHSPYPWDYWPPDDGRADCGYVGLANLGATCYMASCMQHLYMMPQARAAILRAQCRAAGKHEQTLDELQRMFAYLLESERKAYNPRSFCKVYTMDHQPLNTGEQKDMAEFFIDLVSKLEDMTPELKKLVKTLFGGVISNNVVSLDCEHVSRTLEEFYTVRCQVADMRNLYESLDEVTVKDTLEGDNMYTCSQCGKKVRAEKRACFKKLPHILCFNTMRYTFNMVTMLKEKVNTHFSFPMRLDMSGYVEKHLMPQRYQEEKRKSQLRKSELSKESTKVESSNDTSKEEGELDDSDSKEDAKDDSQQAERLDSEDFNECYEYDLIGVTVHTGTADGGHYYSFIRDRTTSNRDKWFLFNDAEVKPFDHNQLAAECFGGEMTSKTYDSVTDKFMDFSFEKTNSAYMLFYEWCSRDGEQRGSKEDSFEPVSVKPAPTLPAFELSKELEDWIWQDNMQFLNDKNIFEHTYAAFMWQVCSIIPHTLVSHPPDITGMAAQLSCSFIFETFIHAKEKPMMVQWVELLTKQFNGSQAACEWFLDHMAQDDWWPMQILIKCPNVIVRQMFQRLCIHVIQRLRHCHTSLYMKSDSEEDGESDESDPDKIGSHSCVTKFVRMLLSLMENGAKAHLKHLTEYFAFLYEFSKMGDEEAQFLISVNAISSMVNFYLGQKSQDYVEIVSEEEEEEDVIPLPMDKYKPATSLEKMITLIASLVEKSRGPNHTLQLSASDQSAIAGGKGFPFLYLQIKDSINLTQTRNLVFALCRWNNALASHIVSMIFNGIIKHTELSQSFFKLLTLMTEGSAVSAGLPCFTNLALQRVWDSADYCPQAALEWLAGQAPRNKLVHAFVLQTMPTWVELYLISHNNQRVRSSAAYLLVTLIPSSHFKSGYRTSRHNINQQKELQMASEAQLILHQVYSVLLRLLKPAKHYTEIQTHGSTKLTAYFALLTYCIISRVEKLMFGPYFMDLWNLFHPKLSEPSIPIHHNKQSLLLFWHHVTVDCPENVQLILHNSQVTKNIAFNYILADHDDQDVVLFNRNMLPAYYGLLRLCCQQSRTFARQLASHQNLQWAFKNITTHPTQYSAAVDELFKLIQLFLVTFPDSTDQELHEIALFRRQTLQLYLQVLDGKSCWATYIMAMRTLIETDDDRLFVAFSNGLHMAFEAFHTLHVMYHEATACHVSSDLLELLAQMLDMAKCMHNYREPKEVRAVLMASSEWPEVPRKLATLLNTYNLPEMRTLCIELLKEFLLLMPVEVINTLVPLLSHCHTAFQDQHNALPMGPFFPRRGHKPPTQSLKAGARPARPIMQMAVPHSQLETTKGIDEEYDKALLDFYSPYHDLIDVMCRLAINNDCMTDALVNLSTMTGFEGVSLHLTYFPKLWLDIYQAHHVERKYIAMLVQSNSLVDYIEAVLLDEKSSLNVQLIYNFLCVYFPKVAPLVLSGQTMSHIETAIGSLAEMMATMNVKTIASKLIGELRALMLVYSSQVNLVPPKQLPLILHQLMAKVKMHQAPAEEQCTPPSETVSKKRKLSTKEEDGPKVAAPTPGCSKDEDGQVAPQTETGDCSGPSTSMSTPVNTPTKPQTDSLLDILEKTINELNAVVASKITTDTS